MSDDLFNGSIGHGYDTSKATYLQQSEGYLNANTGGAHLVEPTASKTIEPHSAPSAEELRRWAEARHQQAIRDELESLRRYVLYCFRVQQGLDWKNAQQQMAQDELRIIERHQTRPGSSPIPAEIIELMQHDAISGRTLASGEGACWVSKVNRDAERAKKNPAAYAKIDYAYAARPDLTYWEQILELCLWVRETIEDPHQRLPQTPAEVRSLCIRGVVWFVILYVLYHMFFGI